MPQNPLKYLKVLLVEDEDKIRQHIATSMRYVVSEVKEAANGEEALKILKTFSPDLIITDLEMPVMNGVNFIKAVRKNGSNVCIVVLTAHTSSEYLLPLIDAHIEHYVIKPVNFDKMLTILEQCHVKLSSLKEELGLPEGYAYDWNQKTLMYENSHISLTKKEISFLELLFNNRHRIVTYDELQKEVWGDSVMTDNAVRSLVKNLRHKLPSDIITNLSGIGYKLA